MTETAFRWLFVGICGFAMLPAILPYYIMLIKDWRRDNIPRKFLETEMKNWNHTTEYREFVKVLLKAWDAYCDEYL